MGSQVDPPSHTDPSYLRYHHQQVQDFLVRTKFRPTVTDYVIWNMVRPRVMPMSLAA